MTQDASYVDNMIDARDFLLDFQSDDDFYLLEVIRRKKDNFGMDQQELARIRTFMPRSTSKKSTGSGFGLAIAFSKIRDHGGLLEIDSEGIGLGTTATITLPSKGETK
jgi:signal transduction histidine kinase